ncbi:hypothetical protein OUZ56_018517 [Daphnia magna]|uniref:Uncharacterized protein n=1 Tax=Daphnia magna TaxID=35525 RepID=A0ABQ9Z931_9CRUS|nr:hypothetical protein OUZ56_018517 [Daphnia magna]
MAGSRRAWSSAISQTNCNRKHCFSPTMEQWTLTTANFTTETKNYGPQPRFDNFPICRSGWELTPFYWAGEIQPVEASAVIPQCDLADAFRYQDVNFFEYQHQTNPAYSEAHINPMGIMADITASMNEHSITGSNQMAGTSAIVVSAAEKQVSQPLPISSRILKSTHSSSCSSLSSY